MLKTNPRPQAAAPSSKLSLSVCRTSLPVLAPSARRVAISNARVDAAARSRFAVFAHATASTKPTTPNTNRMVRYDSTASLPATGEAALSIRTLRFSCDGVAVSQLCTTDARLSSRARGEALGASRANTSTSSFEVRVNGVPPNTSSKAASGAQIAGPPLLLGPVNSGFITPISVTGVPFSHIGLPIAPGSAFSAVDQSWWLTMITGGAPATSS